MQKAAEQENARRIAEEQTNILLREIVFKLRVGTSPEVLRTRFGVSLVARAQTIRDTTSPSMQEAHAIARIRHQEIDRELGRAIHANGGGRQHSEADFEYVLGTQADLQERGENPCASTVLHRAYPDDSGKAKSIGASTKMDRVEQAFRSERIANRPAQLLIKSTHSASELRQRVTHSCFSKSLNENRIMFDKASTISSLAADVEVLKADRASDRVKIAILEDQVRSTKNREALADAGATSSKEKVIALLNAGMTAKPISEALGMRFETVRTIVRRHRTKQKKAG